MDQHLIRFVESLYCAGSEQRRVALLAQYLQNEDTQSGWVLALLLGRLSFPKVALGQLVRVLATRIDAGVMDSVLSAVKDRAEVVARLWKSTGAGDCADDAVLDLRKTLDLLSVPAKSRLDVTAKLLDEFDETRRWVLIQLCTKRMFLRMPAPEVYAAVASVLGLEIREVESMLRLSDPPFADWKRSAESLHSESGRFRGVSFQSFCPPVEVEMEELQRSSHHTGIYFELSGEGKWVQWTSNGHDWALYDTQGEDLRETFPQFISGGSHALTHGTWIAWMPLNAGQMQTAALIPLIALDWEGRQVGNPQICVSEGYFVKALKRDQIGLWKETTQASRMLRISSRAGEELSWSIGLPAQKQVLAILLYAQLPSQRSDALVLSFGLLASKGWIPVAKVDYSTDRVEGRHLSKWIRDHRQRKTGPVIEVEKTLVVELEYRDALPNPRRKSGLELSGCHLKRICWDMTVESVPDFESFQETLSPKTGSGS